MNRTTRNALLGFVLIAALSVAAIVVRAQSQSQPPSQTGNRPRPVGGSVASVSGNTFVLTTRDGRTVTVRTTDSTRIFSRQPATLADIHAGDRVRIFATKAADGHLTAQAVQDIPPALMTGTQNPGGEWQTRGDRVMLGGTVAGTPAAGTIAVTAPNGQSASVAVPSTARLSRMVQVPLSTLAAGTRVMVQGTPNADGSVTASTVFVGGPRGQ